MSACSSGPARSPARLRLRDPGLRAARAAVPPAREQATAEFPEWDEGMLQTGLRAAAQRLPFLPMRAGLGSSVLDNDPALTHRCQPVRRRRTARRRARAHPRRRAGAPEPRRRVRERAVPRTRPVLRRPVLPGGDRAYVRVEQVVDTAGLTVDAPLQSLLVNRTMVDGVVETPNGAHFTTCTPDYERDEPFQAAYVAAARSRRPGRRSSDASSPAASRTTCRP